MNGAVRRVETAYDSQGNAYLFTNYDAATGGSIVNQVQRGYNGLGQLTTEYQSHSGAVNTSTTPKVQYAYTEMASGANHSRITSMTYPNGKVLTYNYSTGLNDGISRLSSLSDSSGSLETYDYLGLSTVVRRGHSQPGVDLTYIKLTGEANGDAGDQYIGLDRFGRVVDQRWIVASTGVARDRFQYGYDRDSNRLYRDNLVNAAFGELYTYDGLNQIASFDRGTLNSTKSGITGTASRTQGWDYDALGNMDGVTTNGTTQSRTANAQNEITSIGSLTTPSYDANGNMTTDETGKQFVYDAWNRLVVVKNSGGTTLETFAYDVIGRRVSGTASSVTTDLYYSSNWQVLEEQVSGTTTTQYVWSPVYVDAIILRDRDTDANGSLDERLWAQQDANWNVTAILNNSGAVVERYVYDAFGKVTVYDASYSVRSGGSSYGWVYLHQGGRLDSVSGLYHFRMRDFSPTLGRWVSVDPIGFGGGVVNLYGYVGNGPGNGLDPSGLAGCPSIEATIVIKGNATSSAEKGKYTPPGGKEFESSDAQLNYRSAYDKRYDGPTEFKAKYIIVFKADNSLDTTKSTVQFTTVNYTVRYGFKEVKNAAFTEEDEKEWIKDGGSVYRHGGIAYVLTPPKLLKDSWSTLPITITEVTLKDCCVVTSFKYKSDKWYPESKAGGLIDKGLEGAINLTTGMATFTGKYQTTTDAVITTYTMAGKIDK